MTEIELEHVLARARGLIAKAESIDKYLEMVFDERTGLLSLSFKTRKLREWFRTTSQSFAINQLVEEATKKFAKETKSCN